MDNQRMSTFGKRLKQLRLDRRLSTRQAAKALGMSQPNLLQYEADRRDVRVEVAQQAATYYGCSLSWLLLGEPGTAPSSLTLPILPGPGTLTLDQRWLGSSPGPLAAVRVGSVQRGGLRPEDWVIVQRVRPSPRDAGRRWVAVEDTIGVRIGPLTRHGQRWGIEGHAMPLPALVGPVVATWLWEGPRG